VLGCKLPQSRTKAPLGSKERKGHSLTLRADKESGVGLPVDDGEHCLQVLRNARSPASLQFFD
jgi:hypothetical protein